MLTIRPQQERIFIPGATKELEARVCGLLREVLPARCAALSAEQLAAVVARRTALGLRAGLYHEDELARLNVFLLAATEDPTHATEPEWATAILTDPTLGPDDRLGRLRTRTHAELG
jgi:hypothetical protein